MEIVDPETNRTEHHLVRRFYSTTDFEEDKTQIVNVNNILAFTGSETSLIAPFDIDEDGKIDILTQKYSENESHDLEFVYNN